MSIVAQVKKMAKGLYWGCRGALVRIGLIESKTVRGKTARMFIGGREVAFWDGEDVEYEAVNFKAVNILGQLEVVELVDAEIKAKIIKRDK